MNESDRQELKAVRDELARTRARLLIDRLKLALNDPFDANTLRQVIAEVITDDYS
jgi:hypothetical protein